MVVGQAAGFRNPAERPLSGREGTFALKPIPMCLLLPQALAKARRKCSWKDLEEIPLVLPEGDGRFARFLRATALDAGIELDVSLPGLGDFSDEYVIAWSHGSQKNWRAVEPPPTAP